MNRDILTVGANPERLRKAAFGAVLRTQDDPAMQLLGVAVALHAMCDALNVDIRRLLESSERLTRDLDGPYAGTIRAIRAYAQGEMR